MVLKASTIKATPFTTFLLLVMIFVVVVFFQAPPPSQPNNSNDTNVWNDHSQQTFARQIRELQEGHQRTLMLLNKLFCEAKLVLPSGGFCLNKDKLIVGGNYMWSAKLCVGLETLFGSSTVADLGAGLGHYGRCFLRNTEGILVHPNTKDIDYINKEYLNKMEEAGLNGTSQVIKSWNDSTPGVECIAAGEPGQVWTCSEIRKGRGLVVWERGRVAEAEQWPCADLSACGWGALWDPFLLMVGDGMVRRKEAIERVLRECVLLADSQYGWGGRVV
nr:uncharacterized protein LOC128703960 [Cherax quadricarinatus]